ncbi:MAG: prepilin-type N-terminal cleavage/methylation domain-containing protein [Patescibacteria group bacterium]
MVTLSPRKRAFTLIELLIVITIIGILAVALVPRLTGGPGRARDAQRKADLQQIATALEFYANDNSGDYPLATTGNCASGLALTSYLTVMPVDPGNDGWSTTYCSGGYAYIPLNTNGGTDIEGYLLVADLETETEKGTGIYNTNFTVTSTSTAAANFSSTSPGNAAKLCSAMTCTDAIVVIGR